MVKVKTKSGLIYAALPPVVFFFLVIILLILSTHQIQAPHQLGDTNVISVQFEKTYESPISIEFLVKVKNRDNSSHNTINLSVILDSLSIPSEQVRNVRMWVHERQERNVTDYRTDCSQEQIGNGSFITLNCTSTRIGSHILYDFVWLDFMNQFFERTAERWNGHFGMATIPRGNANDGFGLGVKEFKVRIELPLSSNGDGWGSAGIMRWNLSGKEFVDLSNSSWWNNTWGRRLVFNITNPYPYAIYNITLNITINNSYVNYDNTLPNGADFRIINGSALEAMWLMVNGTNGVPLYNVTERQETFIYFLVSNFSSGNNTFQLYWNNSGASSVSDMETAFIFGENFTDLNAGWTIGGAADVNKDVLNQTFDSADAQAEITYKNFSDFIRFESRLDNWTGNFTIYFILNVTGVFDSACNSAPYYSVSDNADYFEAAGGNSVGMVICSDTTVTPGTRVRLEREEAGIFTVGTPLVPISLRTPYDVTITKNGTSVVLNISNATYYPNGVSLISVVTLTTNDWDFTYFKIGDKGTGTTGNKNVVEIDNLRMTPSSPAALTFSFGVTEVFSPTPFFNSNTTFPFPPTYGQTFYIASNLTTVSLIKEINASFTAIYPNGSYVLDTAGEIMNRRNGTWGGFVSANSLWNSTSMNVSCYPLFGRNCIGTWSWNITAITNNTATNFSASTFAISDTIKPLVKIDYPNTTLSGSSSPVVTELRLNLSDDIDLDYCHYNISRQDGTYLVTLTTISCKGNVSEALTWNGSFSITDNSDQVYTVNLWANDSQNNVNVTSVSFTWDFTSVGGSGGGGGGGETIIIDITGLPPVCKGTNQTWRVTPDHWDGFIEVDGTRSKTFEFSNLVGEPLNVTLQCIEQFGNLSYTKNGCKYASLSNNNLALPSGRVTVFTRFDVDIKQSGLGLDDEYKILILGRSPTCSFNIPVVLDVEKVVSFNPIKLVQAKFLDKYTINLKNFGFSSKFTIYKGVLWLISMVALFAISLTLLYFRLGFLNFVLPIGSLLALFGGYVVLLFL